MFAILHKAVKAVLVILIFATAVIFTAIAFPDFERTHWYKQVFITIISPPQKVLTSLSNGTRDIFYHYIAISDAAKENGLLKTEIKDLKSRLFEMEGLQKENAQLLTLLKTAGEFKKEAIGAKVISSSPFGEFKTLLINAGQDKGIKKNMAVVANGSLVGKIGEVNSKTSLVLLISDLNSAVDVISSGSRARALLVGRMGTLSLRPFASLTRLEYLHRTSGIKEDDIIVTSGQDSLYPAGIPVGTVHNIKPDTNGILLSADVVPFNDLFSLENVAVLK